MSREKTSSGRKPATPAGPTTENLTPLERAIKEGEAEKAENAEKSRVAQAMRFNFAERKKLLMTYEKHNFAKIYFMHGKKTSWTVMYDHSALFFDKIIGPQIESNAKLVSDKDYDIPSKIGYIRYPDMNKLVEKVKPFVKRVEDVGQGIYAFVLKKPVSKADFRAYLIEAQSVIEAANTNIVPKVIYPELNALLRKTSKLIFDTNRNKMDEAARVMVGYKLYDLISNITTEYVYASRTTKDPVPFLKNALHLIDKAHGRYMSLSYAMIIPNEKLREISEGISKIRNELIKLVAREAHQRVMTENGGDRK